MYYLFNSKNLLIFHPQKLRDNQGPIRTVQSVELTIFRVYN